MQKLALLNGGLDMFFKVKYVFEMIKSRTIIIFLVTIFMCIACSEEWIDPGKVIREEINITEFKKLVIKNNFDIFLYQDTICKIEIEAPEKLIPNINFEFDSEENLSISDNNKNDWLHGYEKIKLHITVNELNLLKVKAVCNVVTIDTLETIELWLYAIDDYSDFDIKLKSQNFYFATAESSGGKYIFSGETYHFGFWARGSSIIDAQNLESVKAKVKSESIGDCYINASESIDAEIFRVGNIYYKGDPQTINYLTEKAETQLIPIN